MTDKPNTIEEKKGFFQYGFTDTDCDDYTHEDFLVGDIEGLKLLRADIDKLLKNGEGEIIFSDDKVNTDLVGIRIADKIKPQKSNHQLILNIIISAILFILSFIFALGIWKLVEFV